MVLVTHPPVECRGAPIAGGHLRVGRQVAQPRLGGLGGHPWGHLHDINHSSSQSGTGTPLLLKEEIGSTLVGSFPRTQEWDKLGGWVPDAGAGESQGHVGATVFSTSQMRTLRIRVK